MDKPILRLGFADYFKPLDEFFIDWLSGSYTIIRDDENPKYLIFCDETFGVSNRKFDEKGQKGEVVKIFFTGENRRPWDYSCHHALSFEHLESNQFYRLPLYVVDNWVQMNKMGLPDFLMKPRNGHAAEKTGFCSFVVSNPACVERNNIFFALSQYKQVDSGGPLFNNIGFVLARDGTNAQQTKFNFISSRKFNLCYENASYPGYVTEKLFHALYNNVVPIYWGSPTVGLDFNQDAFISRHQFMNDAEMIEYITYLDNNDDAYNDILRQPAINKHSQVFDSNRFLRWFQTNVYRG